MHHGSPSYYKLTILVWKKANGIFYVLLPLFIRAFYTKWQQWEALSENVGCKTMILILKSILTFKTVIKLKVIAINLFACFSQNWEALLQFLAL